MLRFSISRSLAVCSISVLLLFASAVYGQNIINIGTVVNSNSPPPLVVPDRSNNRVLIYNAPNSTNQSADIVLGQSSFHTKTAATTAEGMNSPNATTSDSASTLYVSEQFNCRVTQYLQPLTNGKAASLAIGKPDLTTSCGGSASQTNLGNTTGVALDALGNLWVVDNGFNRVLRFSKPFSTGMAANLVIGQTNFTSSTCNQATTTALGPTASTLCGPVGITFDPFGNLLVTDNGNNRVLVYKPPFTTGMNASIELGHPAATAFTSQDPDDGGISKTSLAGPTAIVFDLFSHVWVADSGNNRVLRYDSPLQNGKGASLVLGQSNFTSNGFNTTASTLSNPQGLVLNLLGFSGIWVGDTNNHRTLLFRAPNTTGQAASVVLGQVDFTSNQSNKGNVDPDASTESGPFQAGPSLLALGVLAGLAGIRKLVRRNT